MPSIQHAEFGEITIRRSARARRLSVRFDQHGKLSVTAPRLMPIWLIKKSLNDSREQIRKLQTKRPQSTPYREGELIGHQRTLHLVPATTFRATIGRDQITITYPSREQPLSDTVQAYVSTEISKILRRDARTYLTKRLQILAERYGFHYQRVRFSNASTRWGSCSTSGTISLNIALMRLPLDLIDYVLIHELCHTVEMNHSKAFWARVGTILPQYRSLRGRIKHFTTKL